MNIIRRMAFNFVVSRVLERRVSSVVIIIRQIIKENSKRRVLRQHLCDIEQERDQSLHETLVALWSLRERYGGWLRL